MEVPNHNSSADDDFEQVSANNPDVDQQKSMFAEQLMSKILREVDAVKIENKLLREKNNTLVARVDSFQARLETMEQKLKIAELEAKLAQEQTVKAANEAKLDEVISKLKEEQRKSMEEMQQKFAQQLQLAISKMAEENDTLKKQFLDAKQEYQQEFCVQMASHDQNVKAELQKMAKQLEDNLRGSLNEGITDLGVKFNNLESKTVDGQCKSDEVRKTVDALNMNKLVWSNSKWHIPGQKWVRASPDGLTVTKTIENHNSTNVRAQHPVSRALLATLSGQKLVYWEVQMKNNRASCFGWVGPNVPLNDNKWIVDHPGSYVINCTGYYWESGSNVGGYGKEFSEGDVVGSGLLLTRDHRLKLFFNLNGALNGEPIILEESHDLLLYPALTLYRKDASVEANFGADPVGKPFKFDVNAHETVLFG